VSQEQVDAVRSQPVFARGENRPFAELTLADVRGRADELRAAGGWGPMARVVAVALAWRQLAIAMEQAGVDTVGELDGELLVERAPRLWFTMPG
jgi:hypothetical protein